LPAFFGQSVIARNLAGKDGRRSQAVCPTIFRAGIGSREFTPGTYARAERVGLLFAYTWLIGLNTHEHV